MRIISFLLIALTVSGCASVKSVEYLDDRITRSQGFSQNSINALGTSLRYELETQIQRMEMRLNKLSEIVAGICESAVFSRDRASNDLKSFCFRYRLKKKMADSRAKFKKEYSKELEKLSDEQYEIFSDLDGYGFPPLHYPSKEEK